MSDRELRRRLREAPIPGESEARQRSWRIVRAAWREASPGRSSSSALRYAVVVAAAGALLAVGLSPAGAKVGELIGEAIDGSSDPKPSLTSLPAGGQLLVTSAPGAWVVRQDGSQRLLGDYEEATWSPNGLFVAATAGNRLTAVEPEGGVRWSLAQRREVSNPRWSPSGFRIAYRSGRSLRVVAGDGTGDRLLRRRVAPIAPAWKPLEPGSLERSSSGVGTHLLSFVGRGGALRTVDVDSSRVLWRAELRAGRTPGQLEWVRGSAVTGREGPALLLVLTDRGLETFDSNGTQSFAWNFPADEQPIDMDVSVRGEIAILRRVNDADSGLRSEVVLLDVQSPGRGERRLLSVPGRLSGLAWSPDGRWLLTGWEDAGQWLFLRAEESRGEARTRAVEGIARQFDPGSSALAGFPRIGDWCCERPATAGP